MTENLKSIIQSSSFIREKPFLNSSIISEALFGETLYIKKKQDDWVYGSLSTDNYSGWVNINDLGENVNATHRVITTKATVYAKKNIKTAFMTLSIGSQLSVLNSENKWSKIIINSDLGFKVGFILTSEVVLLNHKLIDWVKISEKLIGTPYFWGGRNSNGLDCSALVQLSLQTASIQFPRDTYLQEKMIYESKIDKNKLKRGDLIFWKGHVGIMKNGTNLIHSNAFHMRVAVEELERACSRIYKKAGIIRKILRINLNEYYSV